MITFSINFTSIVIIMSKYQRISWQGSEGGSFENIKLTCDSGTAASNMFDAFSVFLL